MAERSLVAYGQREEQAQLKTEIYTKYTIWQKTLSLYRTATDANTAKDREIETHNI